MKLKNKKNIILIAAASIFTLCLVVFLVGIMEINAQNNTRVQSLNISDNKAVYKDDTDDVKNIYITILKNNVNSLTDVNNFRFDKNNASAKKPSADVRFDFSKPSSDLLGIKANAQLLPSGQNTTFAAQKSYKINLSKNAGLWNGQKVISLSKDSNDLTRIRSKLSFGLIKLFDNMFSFRSQFCHLYIRDMGSSNTQYADYGLYTQIEQPNTQYLKNHGIAFSAYVYKAENFQFFKYENVIKNVSDPAYNKDSFNSILKIKGIEDHTKLISMLKDVNDQTLNINDVIAKDFDRENYITWLATNILFGNHDTGWKDFLLVSPTDADKWYFIPWNFNKALGYDTQPGVKNKYASWETEGVSDYWSSVLHSRFLKEPQNMKDLSASIEKLSKIANKDKITELVNKYYAETNTIIKSVPDIKYLPSGIEDYEKEIKRLSSTIEENKKKFYEGLKKPMPVWLGTPEGNGSGYSFTWDESYDFQNNDINYDFTISRTPGFTDIVDQKLKIKETNVTVNSLPKGTYYWKVEIYDAAGNRQIAFDKYESPSAGTYFGMKQLVVQ